MFAITFDLTISEVKKHHPKGINRAYEEIRRTLTKNGFVWKQGSVYINPDGGLVELFYAIEALKAIPWFPQLVRKIRAFRMENNSEFKNFMNS